MRIKKPKKLRPGMAVKGSPDMTRQMKRHASVMANVNGYNKRVEIFDLMRSQAKRLPRITNKATGQPFDHYEHMKKIYMEGGIDAVNKYLNTCYLVSKRDKGKTRIGRYFAKVRLEIRQLWREAQ